MCGPGYLCAGDPVPVCGGRRGVRTAFRGPVRSPGCSRPPLPDVTAAWWLCCGPSAAKPPCCTPGNPHAPPATARGAADVGSRREGHGAGRRGRGRRFLLGVKAALGLPAVGPGPDEPEHEVTAVVNTGDDVTMHGLRICPDLDTVHVHPRRRHRRGARLGPGRTRRWTVKEELAAYDADPSWFGLGDRDLATHLVRTRMLDAGYPLSDVTAALCHRWQPGVTLLPMSDDRVETHVVVDDPDTGPGRQAIHFQEWWVRHRAELPAHRVRPGRRGRRRPPAPACATRSPPPTPSCSRRRTRSCRIGTILGVPGPPRRAARRPRPASSACRPSSAARPVRGMADRCLPRSASRPAPRRWAGTTARAPTAGCSTPGWCTPATRADVPGRRRPRRVPLLMTDVDATAAMARAALDLCGAAVG